jgi:hypothetical protein
MKTSYAQHAASYAARGFNPLPVRTGIKHPVLKGWSIWGRDSIPGAKIVEWSADSRNTGICLCTGYGGLIGIDVDDDDAYPAVKEVFGHMHLTAKVGRRGATAFMFDPTGKVANQNIHAKPEGSAPVGRMLVEILSAGRATVIPPTIHPKTGRPYTWRNGDLESCKPSDLPVITLELIASLRAALGPLLPPPPVVEYTPAVKTVVADLEDIERMRMTRYAGRILEQQVAVFGGLQDGQQRNRALFQAICTLGRYIHNGILPECVVVSALKAGAELNGLIADKGEKDFKATIQRALAFSKRDSLPVLKDRSNLIAAARRAPSYARAAA